MPSLPLRRCSRCLERVYQRGKKYCLKHQREVYKEESKYNSDPFYWSVKWREIRLRILERDEYKCQECLRHGRISIANTVDHVVARNKGGADYDYSNLQSLCESCHAKKRGQERGGA